MLNLSRPNVQRFYIIDFSHISFAQLGLLAYCCLLSLCMTSYNTDERNWCVCVWGGEGGREACTYISNILWLRGWWENISLFILVCAIYIRLCNIQPNARLLFWSEDKQCFWGHSKCVLQLQTNFWHKTFHKWINTKQARILEEVLVSRCLSSIWLPLSYVNCCQNWGHVT